MFGNTYHSFVRKDNYNKKYCIHVKCLPKGIVVRVCTHIQKLNLNGTTNYKYNVILSRTKMRFPNGLLLHLTRLENYCALLNGSF